MTSCQNCEKKKNQIFGRDMCCSSNRFPQRIRLNIFPFCENSCVRPTT